MQIKQSDLNIQKNRLLFFSVSICNEHLQGQHFFVWFSFLTSRIFFSFFCFVLLKRYRNGFWFFLVQLIRFLLSISQIQKKALEILQTINRLARHLELSMVMVWTVLSNFNKIQNITFVCMAVCKITPRPRSTIMCFLDWSFNALYFIHFSNSKSFFCLHFSSDCVD